MSQDTRNDRRRKTSRVAHAHQKSKKKIDKVTIIGFAVLLLIIGILGGVYFWQQGEKAREEARLQEILAGALPEGTVATIGDLKVDTSTLAVKYYSDMAQKQQEQKLTDPAAIKDFWRKGIVENQTSMEWLKQKALGEARDFVLYLDFVKKQGFALSAEKQKEFEKTFTDSLARNFGPNVDYKQAINTYLHVSYDNYKKFELNSFLLTEYQKGKLAELKAKVTPNQAEDYFKKNPKNFATKYKVQHILFLTIDATTGKPLSKEKIAQAKANAYKALKRVKAGEDMTKLVMELSQHPYKATDNGIVEVAAQRTDLQQKFKDWGLKNKVNASEVVQTQEGYEVMKQLVSGKESFASANKDIINILASQQLNDLLGKSFSAAPAAKMNDDVFVMLANVLLAA